MTSQYGEPGPSRLACWFGWWLSQPTQGGGRSESGAAGLHVQPEMLKSDLKQEQTRITQILRRMNSLPTACSSLMMPHVTVHKHLDSFLPTH